MVWLILTLTYGRIAIQLNCKPMKLDHVISVLAIFPHFRMLKLQQNHIQNHIHSIWNAHIFSRFFIILRTPSVGASSPPLLGAHGSETIHVETLELCHDLHLLEVTYGTHHALTSTWTLWHSGTWRGTKWIHSLGRTKTTQKKSDYPVKGEMYMFVKRKCAFEIGTNLQK